MTKKQKFLLWLGAALIRALKTFAQAAVALIPIGATVSEVSWWAVLGSAALAAIISILTSIAGLPEVEMSEKLMENAAQK